MGPAATPIEGCVSTEVSTKPRARGGSYVELEHRKKEEARAGQKRRGRLRSGRRMDDGAHGRGSTKYSPLYGNGSTEEALRYERIAQVERSASQAVLSTQQPPAREAAPVAVPAMSAALMQDFNGPGFGITRSSTRARAGNRKGG